MAKKEIEVISLLSSSEDDEEKSVFNVEELQSAEVRARKEKNSSGADSGTEQNGSSDEYAEDLAKLKEILALDPAKKDEELARKLEANAAEADPKLEAAEKAFQRAVKWSQLGLCKWLDTDDDSEDDDAEKEWKRSHPNYYDELSSDEEKRDAKKSRLE